jgi:hypothetical protein
MFLYAAFFKISTANTEDLTVDLRIREGGNTRKAPAYRIIPLYVAHPTCKTSQNAQNFPVIGFLPLQAVPLIEIRPYIIYCAPRSA